MTTPGATDSQALVTPGGPCRRHLDADADDPRLSGGRLAVGLVLAAGLATVVVWGGGRSARLLVPGWAASGGLVVAQIAGVYLAVIVALTVAVGGPSGVQAHLGLRTPSRGDLARGAAALVVAVVVGAMIYLLVGLARGGVGPTLVELVADGSDLARLPGATPTVLALITLRVCLLAGVAEELFFRGALHGWLRTHLGPRATISITAVAFALEHAYFVLLIPLVLALGLATGWVRHTTRGSSVPTLMHIATDLTLLGAAWSLT